MSEEAKDEVVSEQPEVQAEATAEAPAPDGTVAETQSPHKGFLGKVDNWFGITKSKSSYKAEIIAGLTTFMAMVYILIVNPSIFVYADGVTIPGLSFDAMYIATSLGAIVGTMLMALLAKMPLAQASGMGVNAFVVYNLVGGGLTYANAMVFTLLDGVIFILLTVTGLRKYIFTAIPDEVKKAINVGLGLFIAFIGLQNAGVIVNSDSTLVGLVSFNMLKLKDLFNPSFLVTFNNGTVGGMLPAFVAIAGVTATAIMTKKKIKGAILWGILGSTVLFYILAGFGCIGAGDPVLGAMATNGEACKAIFNNITISNPFTAFASWGTESAGKVFYEGFDFSHYLGIEGNNAGSLVVLLITSALSLCMLDMFDTLGTLYGACTKGGLLDENGNPKNMNRCMLADAIATTTGAIAGTSTVTTFVESSAGVAAGGKTGFTALVTGLCFVVAMFLSPLAKLIPSAATATALIWVGVLMMSTVTKIEWTDPAQALPAFLTLAVMSFGYEISYGIGIGIISSVVVRVCTGKIKSVSIVTWIIAAFFLATFLLTH
ncbi:MAG: NCS2 family permease [Clostridia bacterium]|nr:NCS2 family permease [Clostridia bacterium]